MKSTSMAPWVLLASLALGGCDCGSDPSTSPGDGGTGSMDGAWMAGDGPIVIHDGGITITEDGGATFMCYVTACEGHVTECGDCTDNDGDGRTDWRDRECLGPCDNTEGPVLLAGVGGETGGPCKADCYFDFGNGPGNDDCHWDHQCDPLSVAPMFNPEGPTCAYVESLVGGRDCPDPQSETCLDVCRPLTPNGCDCFGCCTFPEIAGRAPSEGGAWVWLGSVVEGTNDGTCTFDQVEDTSACRPCTPVEACWNECGPCEVCIGRPMPPPECYETPDGGTPAWDGGGPPPRCDPGVQVCGLPGEADCPADFYCVTGCCVTVLI